MEHITSKTDPNVSIRLFNKKEIREEILRFRNVNKRDIGTTPYISCPVKDWDEVMVLAVLITRAAKVTLSVFYYDEEKQIMFVACDWFNRNPDEIKAICIDIFKKYLGNPKLCTILYDPNGDPLFAESQQIMDKFMKDLPNDPDEFYTFSYFPNSGYNGIKAMSRFSIFNPSQMGIM